MTFLTRIDPTRNMDRFYIVAVTLTLFGEWAVLRAPRFTGHHATDELRAAH